MDLKQMAQAMRDNMPPSRTDRLALAKFLDNLPVIPPKYTWDGTIREPKKGEDALFKDGVVETIACDSPFAYHYPILRKIEPQFKPGEIVASPHGACYVVRGDGGINNLEGISLERCIPKGVVSATDEVLMDYMSCGYGTNIIRELIRDKYGGGEGEGE